MKLLKFNEVIQFCVSNKCNAFALNEKKHEIFVYEYNEDPYMDKISLFYSKDSGSENETSGIEDFIEVAFATEEFPYLKKLIFFPFNKKDAEYYGTIYFYASKNLLNAAKSK